LEGENKERIAREKEFSSYNESLITLNPPVKLLSQNRRPGGFQEKRKRVKKDNVPGAGAVPCRKKQVKKVYFQLNALF
jgi:hypothetical protein